MDISYRPSMTRRNARYRGPLQSAKYITDVLERRYDLHQLANNVNATHDRLGHAVDDILDVNAAIHHDVEVIEKRIDALEEHIKEVM